MTTDKPDLKNLTNYIFGSSAAIITNTSLVVGLGTAGARKGPIIGGLLMIGIADNISDSLGIHMYKETEGYTEKLSLLATISNFAARLIISCSFVAIVLVLSTYQSIIVTTVWGILLLAVISYLICKKNNEHSVAEISKHVLVAIVVIAISRFVGSVIAKHFS